MRAWELPGFPHAKIRQKDWPAGDYMTWDLAELGWVNGNGRCCKSIQQYFNENDWELFTEPKKTRKVKMYAPIRRYVGGGRDFLNLGVYESQKCPSSHIHQLVGWHEIEVEVTG